MHPLSAVQLCLCLVSMLQWDSVTVAEDGSSDDVASGLLSLAHVMLASGSLQETLPMTTQFYADTISTLIVYSTEGLYNGLLWLRCYCMVLSISIINCSE